MSAKRKDLTANHSTDSKAIQINLSEMPDHVRESLAAATLELVKSILSQPGGRESMDAMQAATAEK